MADETSVRSSSRGGKKETASRPKQFLQVELADGTEKKLDIELSNTTRICVNSIGAALDFKNALDEWSLCSKASWLNPDLPVADQWNQKTDGPLKFRKKYFLTDTALPRVCRERTLLFHQTRKSIATGSYVCTNLQYVRFAALACQFQYGDRDAQKHNKSYVHEFIPEPLWMSLEGHVLDAWTSLAGMVKDDVVYEFTRLAMTEVPTYGVTRFPVVEPGSKDKGRRDLGITQSSIFRIHDNLIVEQIKLEELRTWNFTPKSIELEFLAGVREKYVANTTKGREILALLSEYQYFNRTRGGVSDSLKVHVQLTSTGESKELEVKVDITETSGQLIEKLLAELGEAGLQPVCFSLRSSSRWLTSEEKLGGLRDPEVWLEPRTDLHQAASEGDLGRMVAALERGCPVNAVDLAGDTALHLAVRNGHKMAIIKLLSLKDCNVAAQNSQGLSAVPEELDLSGCGLTRIPVALASCTWLKRLDLSRNLLVTLPTKFAEFQLQQLILEGNPLPTIPKEMISGGASQVCKYLSNVSTVSTWNRFKVLICGSKGSGKSAAARALIQGTGTGQDSPTSSATLGVSVADVVMPDNNLELRVFDICGDEAFATAEALFYSKRAIYCLVFRLSNSTGEEVVSKIQDINAMVQGAPPMIVIATAAAECARQECVLALKQALVPVQSQLVGDALICDSVGDLLVVHERLKDLVATGVSRFDRQDLLVPQSFRSLHSFIVARVAGERKAKFHKATHPALGSNVFHNAVHDHVWEKMRGKEPRLDWVVTRQEFEDLALDAFVSREHGVAASQFLADAGSILLAGKWVVLDVPSVAEHLYDLLKLRGTTLNGVVPYSVLRSLWPELRSSVLPQLISTLEQLDFVANFEARSFIFVPALLVPEKPFQSWPTAVFVPLYITEWRFSDCHCALRFLHACLARVGRLAPVEVVWARGVAIQAEDLHLRVEFSGTPCTKIILTAASKKKSATRIVADLLARWVHIVVDEITDLLNSKTFASLKWERFVRALTMKKPALMRYADLLELQRKGSKAVAVQGANVALELLLPPVPSESSEATTGGQAQVAPASWIRAASVPHLVTCLIVCAESYRLVKDMTALGGSGIPIRVLAENVGLHQALERFGLQTGVGVPGYHACRSNMIDRARAILALLDTGVWSSESLQVERLKVFEMAGAIYAADMGLRMDEPSSALVRAVASKFGCVCSLLGRFLEESGGVSGEVRQQGKHLGARLGSLRALIDSAITLEACLLLEKMCVSLADQCSLLAPKSSSAKPLLDAVELSVEEVVKACRLVEAGSLGRAAVLPLQSVSRLAKEVDSSFDSLCVASFKASRVEQALRDVTHLNGDLAAFLQPVVERIAYEPTDTVFSRLLALKETVRLVDQRHVTELIRAGGGAQAEIMGLGKLAMSAVLNLCEAALSDQSPQAVNPSNRLLQLCAQVDRGLVDLLQELAQSPSKAGEVFLGQQGVWNEFLDFCKASAIVSVRSAFGAAFSALESLWRGCVGPVDGSGLDFGSKYHAVGEKLRDVLLDVQIGPQPHASYQCPGWQSACNQLEQALALSVTERVTLFNGLFGVCELVRELALNGACTNPAQLVTLSIKFVEQVRSLDASIFEMGFATSSLEVTQMASQLQDMLRRIRQNVAGSKSPALDAVVSSTAKESVAEILAMPLPQLMAETFRRLRLVHVFVTRTVAQRSIPNRTEQLSLEKSVSWMRAALAVVQEKGLCGEKMAPVTVHLEKVLKRYLVDCFNPSLGLDLVKALDVAREVLVDEASLSQVRQAIQRDWGTEHIDSVGADGLGDPLAHISEYARMMEASVGEVAWNATHNPFRLSASLTSLVKLVGRVVVALRSMDSLKRYYQSFAPIHAATVGSKSCMFEGVSLADRTLILAKAVSLLCEGLDEGVNASEESVGRKGMMAVREALGQYAADPQPSAKSFALACASLSSALANVAVVKGPYQQVVRLVDSGLHLEQLMQVSKMLLQDGSSLMNQHAWSKQRNVLVASLQEVLNELKRSIRQASPVSSPRGSPPASPPRSPRVDDLPSPSSSPRPVNAPKSPRTANNTVVVEAMPQKSPRGAEAGKTSTISSAPAPAAVKQHQKSTVAVAEEAGSDDGGDLDSGESKEEEDEEEDDGYKVDVKVTALVQSPTDEKLASPLVDAGDAGPNEERRCRAIFKYNAKGDDELSFQRGDQIILDPSVDVDQAGIWRGRLAAGGPTLAFQSKYVKLLE